MGTTETAGGRAAEIAELLTADPLIGVSAAAKLIPVKPPNFKRDVAPHLTRIPVEGSADVYLRSEVEAFARAKAAARSNGHASGAG